MKTQECATFRLSKTGVKVYLRPEYHPVLKGTDLSHPDFVRKSSEVFGRESGNGVRGLPKICSENSEDAQTWHYFSPLLSMSKDRSRQATTNEGARKEAANGIYSSMSTST